MEVNKESLVKQLKDLLKMYEDGAKARSASHVKLAVNMTNEAFRELIEKLEKAE